RQLVLECHDRISSARAFCGTAKKSLGTDGLVCDGETAVLGSTNEGRNVGARRDVDSPRAAVIGVALQRARRLASLNVNGIAPNLLSPARPKKRKPPVATHWSIRWWPGGHGEKLAVAPWLCVAVFRRVCSEQRLLWMFLCGDLSRSSARVVGSAVACGAGAMPRPSNSANIPAGNGGASVNLTLLYVTCARVTQLTRSRRQPMYYA